MFLSLHQKPTLEFVLLWFNLICAGPHKLFSFKHYHVKIKIIIIIFIIIIIIIIIITMILHVKR